MALHMIYKHRANVEPPPLITLTNFELYFSAKIPLLQYCVFPIISFFPIFFPSLSFLIDLFRYFTQEFHICTFPSKACDITTIRLLLWDCIDDLHQVRWFGSSDRDQPKRQQLCDHL